MKSDENWWNLMKSRNLSLITNLWPLAGPSLQQMLLWILTFLILMYFFAECEDYPYDVSEIFWGSNPFLGPCCKSTPCSITSSGANRAQVRSRSRWSGERKQRLLAEAVWKTERSSRVIDRTLPEGCGHGIARHPTYPYPYLILCQTFVAHLVIEPQATWMLG